MSTTSPHSASPAGDAPGLLPLSRVVPGQPRAIERVTGAARAELEREGMLPGSVVVVAARTPLGGPVVVELGRSRLALSADVAAQVLTRACDTGQVA